MSKINGIRSSKNLASKASRVLRSGLTSKTAKSLGANVLGNRASRTK